jgi:acetamidase/formamidase
MAGEDTSQRGGRFVFGEDTEHLISDIIYQPGWGVVHVQPVFGVLTEHLLSDIIYQPEWGMVHAQPVFGIQLVFGVLTEHLAKQYYLLIQKCKY